MNDLFNQYEQLLKNGNVSCIEKALPEELLIEQNKDLAVFYAPFDYVNKHAKIVLCGITPGLQQAELALREASIQLRNGSTSEQAKLAAKNTASFGGPMRSNLVRMLDFVGINKVLGVTSTSDLFSTSAHLVHYTSALRYPVFKSGKNYSGTPSMLSNPLLRKQVDSFLVPELSSLNDQTIYIPLGPKVEEVLNYCAKIGVIKFDQVLGGLPHPSGANAERIAYFLNEKPKDQLSVKTNPDKIDLAREIILNKVNKLTQ